MAEKRIDPEDGTAYTWEELSAFYKGKYKSNEIDAYWNSCKPTKGGTAAKEKRIDPEDGMAYTFEELGKFYKGKYTQKEIDAYWKTCTPPKAAAGYPAEVKTKTQSRRNDMATVMIQYCGG